MKKILVFFLIFNFVTSWFYGLITTADFFAPKKAEATSAWNIRQEINILDGYLGAVANNVATSSEIIRFDPTVYSGTKTYYLEIVASTSASFSNTVTLRRSGTGTDDCTVTIPTSTTAYTLVRSSSCALSTSATDYVLRISSNAGGTTGIKSARLIILQSFAGTANSMATSTQTQIEIGNRETGKTNTTTGTLSYPKYWTYDSSKWDGGLSFYVDVSFKTGTQVSSSTLYTVPGTYTYIVSPGSSYTQVELWGSGGAGRCSTSNAGGGGGGGGAYARSTTTPVVGSSHTVVVSATTTCNTTTSNDSTYDTTAVVADGGNGAGASATGGTGGNTTNSVGDVEAAGGTGGTALGTNDTGGGGGGAGGPNGNGGSGSNGPSGATTSGGGGGGGNGGSTASNTATGGSSTYGGAGGNGGASSANGSIGASHIYGGGGGGGSGSTALRGGPGGSPGGGGGGGDATASGTLGEGGRGQARLTETHGAVGIALEEDNGTFGGWTFKKQIVYGGVATSTASTTRSASFTPTSGRHYRLVASTTNSGVTYDIYNAKIVVDQVNGSVVDTTYNESNRNTDGSLGNNQGAAESFQSNGGTLSVVKWYLSGSSNPDGTMVAKLYDITGTFGTDSYPTGTALAASDPVDESTLPAAPSNGLITFNFTGANKYAMTSGNRYAISIETSNQTMGAVNVGIDTTSPSYDGDASSFIGSWNYVSGRDNIFYVYVESTDIIKLEPQYLLANTKLDAGTSAQKFLTKWDTSEWSGVANTYLYAVDATDNSTSAVVLSNISGGSTVTGSTVTSPDNHATSTSMTMPSTSTFDVTATTNNNDVYGARILAQVSVAQPVSTTLGNGTNPSSSTIAPGSSATDIDNFTFTTSSGSDSITDLTVQILPALATTTISQVQITNTSNTDVCTAINITDTSSNILTFTCSSLTASALAGGVPYKIRITPKTHANMPAVPGASYAVTATTTGWTGTNTTHAGSDTNSATITIDNLSPSEVTGASASVGDSQISLTWTNPVDSDLSRIMVLASTSAITFTPVEGTTYSTSTLAGASRVACYGLQTSCVDTSLTNGTAYYYKVYALDSNGNWSPIGVTPTGSPITPVGSVVLSGVVYQSETGSPATSKSVKVYKNGTTLIGSATSDGTNGTWSATLSPNPSSGDIVTVYIDNDAINANTVFVSDGLDKSNINLYGGNLVVRHDTGSSITNANLHTGAIYGEADMMYSTSTSNAITLESNANLLVYTGDTYLSGGVVITQGTGDFRVSTSSIAYLNINGNTIAGDIVAYDGSYVYIDGNTSVNGGDIKTQGTSNTGNFLYTQGVSTPTIILSGTGTISDGNPTSTFYKLTISGTGNITNASAIVVDYNLTVSSGGSLSFSSGSVSMGNGSLISNSGTLSFNSLVIPSGASVITSSNFSIGGNLTVGTGGTFSPSFGTITINNSSFISNSGTLSFFGLAISNGVSVTAGSYSMKSNLTVGSGATLSSTNVTMENGSYISNSGNLSFDSLIISPSASVGTASSFVTGDITVGSLGELMATAGTIRVGGVITNDGNLTFNNLEVAASSAVSSFSVSGNLDILDEGFYISSGATVTVGGNLTVGTGGMYSDGDIVVNGGNATGSGAVNMTGGVFTLDGTGLFGGSDSNWTFNELKFGDGTSVATTTTSTGTGTITSATTTVSANQILDAGVSKTWNLTSSFEPLQLQGTLLASSSTFVYQGTNNATVTPTTYYNLEISPASGNPTYLIGTTTGQTVTVNNNFVLGGVGNVTLNANNYNPIINIGGTLTIGSGDIFQASNSDLLTIFGDFTNNGTFTHNNGTVKFTPGTSSTINSASSMSFYNLEFTSAGKTLKFQNHLSNNPIFTIAGSFTATGSDVDNPVYIESTSYGDQWLVSFSTEQAFITHTSFRDSGCATGSSSVTSTTKYDRGNNGTCWGFVGGPTPPHYRGGGFAIEFGSGGGITITGGIPGDDGDSVESVSGGGGTVTGGTTEGGGDAAP